MRARIIELNEFTLVLKDEKKRFLTVDRERLNFEYQLGDTVEIETGTDGKYTFRVFGGNEPLEGDDFAIKEAIKPTEEAKRELKKHNQAPTDKGEPLGGWLLLFDVYFYAFAVNYLLSVTIYGNFITQLSPEACEILNQQFNNSCTSYNEALVANSIMSATIFCFALAAAILITCHRKAGKIFSIVFCIIDMVWELIYLACFAFIDLIHTLPNETITAIRLAATINIFITAIRAAIMIPYFLKSERVKYTLTRSREKQDDTQGID